MTGRLVVVALNHSRVHDQWVQICFGILSQRGVSSLPFILCLSTLAWEYLMNLILCFLYGHSLSIGYQHVIYDSASSKHVGIKWAIRQMILFDFWNSLDCNIISSVILMGHQIHMSQLRLTLTIQIHSKRLEWTRGVYISVRVDLCVLLDGTASVAECIQLALVLKLYLKHISYLFEVFFLYVLKHIFLFTIFLTACQISDINRQLLTCLYLCRSIIIRSFGWVYF